MLRITKQTDYGIVLMARLTAGGSGVVHNARDLAAGVNLPLPTVSKILKALARAGLVVSHRGVKGGYSVTRDPHAISVAEVIEALEGPIALTTCLDTAADDCEIECSCPVRANWLVINSAVRDALVEIPLSRMTAAVSFPLHEAKV